MAIVCATVGAAAGSLDVLPVPTGPLSQQPDVPGRGGRGDDSFPCEPVADAGVCVCTATANGVAVVCRSSGQEAADANVSD